MKEVLPVREVLPQRQYPLIFEYAIITDNNIESTNFLYSESEQHLPEILRLIETYSVITMGGFIGKTTDGIVTTYERGGSDRTAVDMGILLHKKFNVSINFEKDFAVYSADPRIVKDGSMINELSYNEARLAATFGMKILDPIAIKEFSFQKWPLVLPRCMRAH